MTLEKENFLRTKLIPCIQRIDPSAAPLWGKMNVQQMIEHLAIDAVPCASGKLKIKDIITPPEHLQKLREFLITEKAFKANTNNPLMAKDPPTCYYKTIQGAIGALHEELIYFFEVFEKNPALVTRNPFFGDLNFEQNVQLLYKHALHHLRQFGAEPEY